MPYRLQKHESVVSGLKRVAEEEITGATEELQSTGDLGHNIYEMRRRIKKVRAVLRLIEPPLGPIYVEENRRLRDLASRFAPLRDLDVCLELLDKFASHYKRKTTLDPQRLEISQKKAALNEHADWKVELSESLQALNAIRKRVEDWPLHGLCAEFLDERVRKTHKKSRRALRVAVKTRTPEDFHELRKSVKREFNQNRLLNAPDEQVEDLKELSRLLGDHHNLAVLMASLSNPSQRFRRMMLHELRQLESLILPLASRIYADHHQTAAA